jgi:alcohol dehydrogenase, propanol-preferring
MKTVVISAPKSQPKVEDRPKPTPKAGQVLIKVKACGVCHSDLNVRDGLFPFATYPRVPGHEVAGVVESVGEGVTWPKVGDRVGMPWLYSSCGHCRYCVRGDEILCSEAQVTGVTRDGGFAEYMIAPALYVAPIPEGLEFADAGPLMCAGLTVYNGMRVAGVKPGDRVAVIGVGGLGHLGIRFAKALGCKVAAISNTADKEKESREYGADKFINSKDQNVADELRAWGGGADVILQTAPSTEPATQTFPGLAPDGTLVVLGIGPGTVVTSPNDLISGRRRLMGSPSGSRQDTRDTLDFALNADVRPEITKYRLDQAAEVLELMHQGKVRGRAVLMMD